MKVIDIHDKTVLEAKKYLEKYLASYNDPVIKEIKIIHGKSSLNLANMVRNDLRSKKIKRKILTMNNGETILILK